MPFMDPQVGQRRVDDLAPLGGIIILVCLPWQRVDRSCVDQRRARFGIGIDDQSQLDFNASTVLQPGGNLPFGS